MPDQTPEYVEGVVKKYLEKQWAKRGSTNTCKVSTVRGVSMYDTDGLRKRPVFRGGRVSMYDTLGFERGLPYCWFETTLG